MTRVLYFGLLLKLMRVTSALSKTQAGLEMETNEKARQRITSDSFNSIDREKKNSIT